MARNQTKKKGYRVGHKRRKTRNQWLYVNGGTDPPPADAPATDAKENKKDGDDDYKGDTIPDREQATDFIFYNPKLNPASGYTKYIVVNQPPKYMYMFDSLGYQIMGIEEMLYALSTNRPLIPSYRVRKNIKTTKARSEKEIAEGKKKLEAKKEKYREKIIELDRQTRT